MGKAIKDTLNIVIPTGTSDKDDSKTSNSNALPSGGTTGQVLTKKSDNDLDTLWQTVSGGAGGVETVNSVSPDGSGNISLTQDTMPDGTNYKQYSQTEKTKLAGIATGAQVNTSKVKASATDTTEGYLGDKLVQGKNVTITKNNSGANETYTIASTGVTAYADLAAIKAVDTTSYTDVQTIQITSLGLYKFQPASTLVADDINVIAPTVGAGRWIKQSQKVYNKYNFRPADYGAGQAFFKEKPNGNLVTGLAGAYSDGSDKGIITCDALIGSGNYVKFRVNGISGAPAFWISSNGSYDVKTTDFKGFGVTVSSSGMCTVIKKVGSTKTTLKTLLFPIPADVIIRKYNNRCSVTIIDCLNQTRKSSFAWEDVALMDGNIQGFSGGNSTYVTNFKNIEIETLSDYGKNILIDGDSQTASDAVKPGCGTIDYFDILTKNKNLNMKPLAYGGKKLQDAINKFPTEAAVEESIYAENVYYVNLGTNDYSALTATDMLTKLDSLITLAKASNFKIAVSTVCMYNGGVAPSAVLSAYNQGIRDRKTSGQIDYLFDMYESKWGIIDPATGAVYRKYTMPDGLHFTPELREIVAKGIIETIGIDLMPNIVTDYTEEEYCDSVPIFPAEITKINSIDQVFTSAEKTKLTAINAVGTAVASATTITVPANKTIFHITGTTAISTINLPYAGFTGKISIIPDGIFTFDTAGNIAEAYTATVSRVIDLVYDGTKWYRV